MSNYVKATNFTAKDSLPSGNPSKIVKGAEIDTEFTAIASAVSSKADLNSPALTGTPTAPTASTGTNTTQLATTAFVKGEITALSLGNMSTQNKTAVDITGGTITGVSVSGLAADLAVSDGGTGRSSLTANNVILGNGTSAVNFVAPGTSGNVLSSNGTTWSSSPLAAVGVGQTWQSVSRTAGVTYTNTTGKPICFLMCFAGAPGAADNDNVLLTIGSTTMVFIQGVYVDGVVFGQNTAIIPAGSTYQYTQGTSVSKNIYELR